jgi:glycosyltransferase involved in cell wall biosynthesis
MDKKKVLILCYNYLVSDPRVQRQIEALLPDFDIEVCAMGDTGIKGIPFHLIYKQPPFSLIRKLKRLFWFIFRMYEKFYWDDYKKKLVTELSPKKYDVVIANDIQTLPLALGIAGNQSKVYFDSHDYHPREFEDDFTWRVMHKPNIGFLCRKYIPQAAAFSTSSQSIADAYYKYLNILPHVITNATRFHELEPPVTKGDEIKLIHHGAAIKGRKIEVMIETMKHLDKKYSLHLMLTGKGSAYYNQLKEAAAGYSNIFFLDPVPFKDIISTINKYDIGFYCLASSNFNNRNLLPNKIFEFVQARLCIVVSPTYEMEKLVNDYKLGVVSSGYTAENMANAIKTLTPEKIMQYKQNSNLAAKTLTSEPNLKKIHSIVSNLAAK